MKPRSDARVLIVGVGGLGCPAALALARGGVGALRLCDDDRVELQNLHRQILFDEASVGKPKLEQAARALGAWSDGDCELELTPTRFLPGSARELLEGCDLVVEGADNFATKFVVADACRIAGVAVVHASAVRTHGTVLAVGARGRPCYRCIFEDLPREHVQNCDEAGVLGPMVGLVGALQADLALAVLDGRDVAGALVRYDAEADRVRRTRISARAACPLCGEEPEIRDLDEARYTGERCVAGTAGHG